MSRALLILAALCYAAAGFGALAQRYHWLPFKFAFGAVVLGLLGTAIVALIALGCLVFSDGRRAYITPLAVAALPLGALLLALAPRLRAPLVNDVSTQGGVVPFRQVAQLRGPDDNLLEPAPPNSYPNLHPLRLAKPQAVVYEAAMAEAQAQGWTITDAEPPQRFEAISYTPWLRFADDVAIVIEPTADGSQVRMRSASRVGRGDLGQNARRIERFFLRLRTRLGAP